jgi:hypothetical protein
VFDDMAMIGDGQFSPRLFLSSSGENLPPKKQVQSIIAPLKQNERSSFDV